MTPTPGAPLRTAVVDSPLGPIFLAASDEALLEVAFDRPASDPVGGGSALLVEAAAQLRAWFAGKRRDFDLPLDPRGTPFQRQVWEALLRIPRGQTRSYAEMARAVGRPAAVRAVGAANGRNPLAVIVPCHRVVGSDGSLTGYRGGLERKRWLLDHERAS